MAKPAGITTGDGTEAHPWEVHNYEEIKWACEDAEAIPTGQTATSGYVYINLVNDIDCQEYDVDFTWSITCLHSIYLDLCQHTIETFYITGSGYMFRSNVNSGDYYIGNGKILNVYGYWDGGSMGVFMFITSNNHAVLIENISFSIDMSKLSTIYYMNNIGVTLYTIKNCSFWIQGDRREATVYRDLLPFSGMVSCCDFYLNDVKTINSGIVTGYSASQTTVLTNCRFQGNYSEKITSTGGAQYLFSNAILRNCVFDLGINRDSTSTGTSALGFVNNVSTSNTGIYNSEKIVANLQYIPDGYVPCLTSEMDRRVNPNADNILRDDKHFDVITG